jgi:hypothetical protein
MHRVVAGLAVVGVLLAGGCSADQETTPVAVTSGAQGPQKWQILASTDESGELCLELRLAGSTSSETGGCGFDDSNGDGREGSWDADDGSTVYFGPVSAAAVKVRVAVVGEKTKEEPTQALPTGLVKGRVYAVSRTGDSDPTVTPIDASGAEVPAQDF